MRPDTVTGTISLDAVSVERGGRRILRDVSLGIEGGTTAVIGANGSGKSTFARLLNGLVRPSSGQVRVLGWDPSRDTRVLRQRVGFVFTDPQAQILMPTPAEDLALSLRGRPRAEVADRVDAILDDYGLTSHAHAPAFELSGGQKQLLALASVLATEPHLLVADEPTTLLDLRNARRIADVLLSQSMPCVIVTHDLELAGRCDRVVLFDDGRLLAVDEPDAVVAAYRRVCA